jgi:hypothetical protein
MVGWWDEVGWIKGLGGGVPGRGVCLRRVWVWLWGSNKLFIGGVSWLFTHWKVHDDSQVFDSRCVGMHSSTRAMVALTLMLLPGLGTGALQAGVPSFSAFSQSARVQSNMTSSDLVVDFDFVGANTSSESVLTEITDRLSIRDREYFIGTIRISLAPSTVLTPMVGWSESETFLAMSQVLHMHLGTEVTVKGVLSANGGVLQLASVGSEVYRVLASTKL